MNGTQDGDIPVDIWRYILLYVAPSSIHYCCTINKLFNNLCCEPKLYRNLVCCIKCFCPVPLKINDNTATISISVYDKCNSYLKKSGETDAETNNPNKVFEIWLKRLSKCKYLDMSASLLDEEYLHNEPLKRNIQNIIHLNNDFQALHFDAFYSKQVKMWFLSYILPLLSSEIRHISLRWDDWAISSLQIIDNFCKVFDHFWVSIDGRSHAFQFPLLSYRHQRYRIKLQHLQILSIYRLYFPSNTLQCLLSASCNLKILYMFASSWKNEDSTFENIVTIPSQIRSVSILLCDGKILFNKCLDLRHIMLDASTNEICTSILQQLKNGTQYPNLRQLSIGFWSGLSDKSEDVSEEKELQLLVNLVNDIHQAGKTKLFDTLSINMYDEIIQQALTQKLIDKLSVLYMQQFKFYVTNVQNMSTNCQFIIDDQHDKKFIRDIFRRRFGLIRNS